MERLRRLVGSSAASAVFSMVVMCGAGIAVASVNGGALVSQAHSIAHRPAGTDVSPVGNPTGPSSQDGADHHGSGDGASATDPATCRATVTAVEGSVPSAGDTTGLQHAIAVVEANCEKEPQAVGLVNALQRLLDNSSRSHPAGAAGQDPNGNANGNATDHSTVDGAGSTTQGHQSGTGGSTGGDAGGSTPGGSGKGAGHANG